MRRAWLLAVGAVALAGCSSSGGGNLLGGSGGGASGPAVTAVVESQAAGASAGASAVAPSTPTSSAPPALSAAAIDPCTLLTKAQADKVAGTTTMKPVRAQMMCTFATPTSGSVGQVEVYVGDGAKKSLDIDKTELQHTFRQVAGVGDEAWLEQANIFFRVQDVWFQLRVVRLDDVNTDPLLIEAAKIVVGRV